MKTPRHITWVEISASALRENVKTVRRCIGKKVILAPSVKANAYGHGIVECARIFSKCGADWLCVNALFEARTLRNAKIELPIYIKGYVLKSDLPEALALDARLVLYNKESAIALERAARKCNRVARVHIKVETGNHRQGVMISELRDFFDFLARCRKISIEGISTHFADLEDTADHEYANYQLKQFHTALAIAQRCGINPRYIHCANSAATLLMPQTHFTMVRPGISVFGMWPSPIIRDQALPSVRLEPALTWKSRIAQVKSIPKGAFIGYGRTYRTKRASTLAVIPVGYYDGYDRGLSNIGAVLIRGKRAPVLGRVCMNMIMVDVTKMPNARIEEEVVLLGKQGADEISADEMADWLGTINYEVATRINEMIPRIVR